MPVGVRVKGGADLRVGAIEETVMSRADTAKMFVLRCRKKKHVLIHERLNDERVGGCGITPELQSLGKMMRASSGTRCKRCESNR
jgi:hypothetical protein